MQGNLLWVHFAGEEDTAMIKWMWLYRGEMKRCYCGYWFKMVDSPVVDYGH